MLDATSPAASAVGMLWLLKGVTPSRSPMSSSPSSYSELGSGPLGGGGARSWGALGASPPASFLLHSPQTPQRTKACRDKDTQSLSPGQCLPPVRGTRPCSYSGPRPPPGTPPCPLSGRLPINDRCGPHNSLCLFPETVCGADAHQGPEPPADPHGTVPRGRFCHLSRPGWTAH